MERGGSSCLSVMPADLTPKAVELRLLLHPSTERRLDLGLAFGEQGNSTQILESSGEADLYPKTVDAGLILRALYGFRSLHVLRDERRGETVSIRTAEIVDI
jgi:hypothetical protein